MKGIEILEMSEDVGPLSWKFHVTFKLSVVSASREELELLHQGPLSEVIYKYRKEVQGK